MGGRHLIICGASGGHTHPLDGNALTLIGGSGTQLTHVFTLTRVGSVCLIITWDVVYLIIYGCRRNIGALISMRLHGGRENHMSAFALEVPPKMEWAPLVDVGVEAREVYRDDVHS